MFIATLIYALLMLAPFIVPVIGFGLVAWALVAYLRGKT